MVLVGNNSLFQALTFPWDFLSIEGWMVWLNCCSLSSPAALTCLATWQYEALVENLLIPVHQVDTNHHSVAPIGFGILKQTVHGQDVWYSNTNDRKVDHKILDSSHIS